MHFICVWNKIKQSKPLQRRYDTTYIYDRNYIRTHVYMFLFSVKKRVFASATVRGSLLCRDAASDHLEKKSTMTCK